MEEACGVFGIYAPGVEVASLVFDGIFALQHRGQESAGIAVSDNVSITVVKDLGLVTRVFDQNTLQSLSGCIGLGHVRYSTAGKKDWMSAQPAYRSAGEVGFALGHNGNLTNVEELASLANMLPGVFTSDSDIVAELISQRINFLQSQQVPDTKDSFESNDTTCVPEENDKNNLLLAALFDILPRTQGAFSFGLIDANQLIAIRDPNGFRPLCLGKLPSGNNSPTSYAIASESPALDIVGADFIREIQPGEVLVIDEAGLRSYFPFPKEQIKPSLCLFEFVYFARPDAVLCGSEVHATRLRMGMHLAMQAPADADLVIGVPDSGVPAAEGFAMQSGIPYGQGLVKNRYIGRTFITPNQKARTDAVRRKLNPLKENVKGKRLVVVDDSIVRGTTIRQIVSILRDVGATEVHLRVSSPPFKWPCFYGIDTPSREELLAAKYTEEEMMDILDVDSISYLSLESLFAAVNVGRNGFCDACLTGNYPTKIPVTL
ncbi:MAG: amidophosphoribosyltransferase [Firmicutes bacterium]|nr:amidophosphoribosyltransferase [Bacillota bacterium]